MPSSVRDGTRPRAARMRLYSSAVMLCEASNGGVTVTGSGTTEEAVVITVASIVARRLRCGRIPSAARHAEKWLRGVERRADDPEDGLGAHLAKAKNPEDGTR